MNKNNEEGDEKSVPEKHSYEQHQSLGIKIGESGGNKSIENNVLVMMMMPCSSLLVSKEKLLFVELHLVFHLFPFYSLFHLLSGFILGFHDKS